MQLVDRTLNALEIMSKNLDGISISDLSEQLEIPASSTHRILSSLKENHFVLQDEDTKQYRLGYKIFGMAADLGKKRALTFVARPYMKRLSEETGRSVILCMMEHRMVMNIACIERKDSSFHIGRNCQEIPLYLTAAGRVFAAGMDRGTALSILEKENRTKATPFTKTDLQELNRELDLVSRSGYSLIDEEFQMGIQEAACPLLDVNGDTAAALVFINPKNRDRAGLEARIERLKHIAEEISKNIR